MGLRHIYQHLAGLIVWHLAGILCQYDIDNLHLIDEHWSIQISPCVLSILYAVSYMK